MREIAQGTWNEKNNKVRRSMEIRKSTSKIGKFNGVVGLNKFQLLPVLKEIRR